MPRTGRRIRIHALAILVGLLAWPVAAYAVDDTTPPHGTLVINGGAEWTADPTLTLDVPASDDVGVTLIRVHHSSTGTWSAWTELPYAPQVTYSLGDPGSLADGPVTVEVDWRDAAFNGFSAMSSIGLDRTPPEFHTFQQWSDTGPAGTLTFNLGANDPSSGVVAARLSTTNGAPWGAEIPIVDQLAVWDPRDPSTGGSPSGIGDVSVAAQVRDAVGNWSNVRTLTLTLSATVEIAVSAKPTTGNPVTFTPVWSAPVALPSGTRCMWEFMIGDDQSLYHGNRNDTFSYTLTQGPSSGGWCGPWTFTLPWSSVRQYLVAFRAILPDGTVIDDTIGGSPDETAFTAGVGSTSRSIKSSTLPMFYVLPDDYQLILGVPTTYRAFAVGGASIRSSDQWVVEYENVPEFYAGSAALTFTPKKTGHLTVCLYRRAGPGDPMDQLGACFDPPVKAGSGGGGAGGSATASPAAASAEPGASGPGSSPDPSGAETQRPSPPAGEVAAVDPSTTAGAMPDAATPTVSEQPRASLGWLMVAAILIAAGGSLALLHPALRARAARLRDRVTGPRRPGG
ncbi:MAG: hypothetical protein AB1736_08150 [Chloroflexota bacterium]